MLFDGRVFAQEIEEKVKNEVLGMPEKPHIVSLLVGSDPASLLYTNLKKKAAVRVGIEYEVADLPISPVEVLMETLKTAGERSDVSGVMVQMPIPGLSRDEQADVLRAIPLKKDVDGLRWDVSGVVPATVRAVLSILEKLENEEPSIWQQKFVVVGTHGSVGKPLIHFLAKRGVHSLAEVNSRTENRDSIIHGAEILISAVGKAGIITAEMVSKNCIAIDVGMSKADGKIVGDMTPGVYAQARIAVPVPGGVGPLTVISLMEAAVEIAG